MVTRYELVVSGTASPLIRAAFQGFDVEPVGGRLIRIRAAVPDEAALHGVLHRLQDLGLTIMEVRRLEESGDAMVTRTEPPVDPHLSSAEDDSPAMPHDGR